MKDTEKLRIIRNNLSDGLHVPFNPSDDNYAISDLRIKLTVFDFALNGLKDKSEYSVVKHEDVINLVVYWLNISINLEQALSLLEYVDAALDPRDDIIEFEDVYHWEFSIKRVKAAIEKYRERRAELHKQQEKEGLR